VSLESSTSDRSSRAQRTPTVAVIVPCFNDGATLAEAVRTAQTQSRIDELIVVNDGSTDQATLEVMGALESEEVTVLHRLNGGLAQARMSGVEASDADYVLALDADDRLLPGALAALADALDRDEHLTLAWGDYELFGDHTYRQQTAATLDPWQITYQNDLPSSAMIRRSALLAAGGWRASGGYEDWDLWMSLAESSAQGLRLESSVYEYRQHGVRMLTESATRHDVLFTQLRQRHPALFASRRSSWRRSGAPLALRLALPTIFALPIALDRKRLLGGAACHLAHRRGVGLLIRRVGGT
jgi:glycosyltransferase involved in cell wall biosynthesis